MTKRIALSLLLSMVSLTACSEAKAEKRECKPYENEWHGEVADFETRKFTSEKGTHHLIAVADQPIRCAVYRDGKPIPESIMESNTCGVKYESPEKETLVFFIIYDFKAAKKTEFKYHASVI